jgi:hypothetical protein
VVDRTALSIFEGETLGVRPTVDSLSIRFRSSAGADDPTKPTRQRDDYKVGRRANLDDPPIHQGEEPCRILRGGPKGVRQRDPGPNRRIDHPVEQEPTACNAPVWKDGNSIPNDGDGTRDRHAAEPASRER